MNSFPASVRLAAAVAFAVALQSDIASGQTNRATSEREPLGSTITVDALATLPSSASLYTLVDVSMPEVVGDRVDSGGLSTGESGRLGAHGSSWTQTTYKLDGVDITAPGGSGTPLFVPGITSWQQVDVATGLLPIQVNSPGLAILLTPRSASSQRWTRTFELFGSPSGLNAHNDLAVPPPISRLDNWVNTSLSAGGPLAEGRVAPFLSLTGTKSSRYDRGEAAAVDSSLMSAFGSISLAPTAADRVRIIGVLQRTSYPFASRFAWNQPLATTKDASGHVQVRWDRQATARTGVSLTASLSRRGRGQDVLSSDVFVERLRDGTVPDVAMTGAGSERTWSLGAQITPAEIAVGSSRHALLAGAELAGASAGLDPADPVRVGELVNDTPARLWEFSRSSESSWHSRTLALYVGDSIDLSPRVRLDFGLRFESLGGSADGAETDVSWRNLFPRAGIRTELFRRGRIAGLISYGRYGYRLPLQDLAWGDPNAPVASVFRWTGTSLSRGGIGPVIQRLGPGTGGDPNFSGIDSTLARPYMDDVTLGFEARPGASTLMRLVGIARRDTNLLGVVDTGAPLATAYSTQLIPDPGVDLFTTADDKQVPVYSRLASSFGKDRYLLTNPADDNVTYVGIDFTMQVRTERLFFVFGGTAGRSEGIAASRGFLATENDAGLLGEAFINPNARTNAQGRLFTERGYTGKIAMVYRLPQDISLGLAARYMDGQHFARILIASDLSQGPEPIRAFQNGKTRFTYTGTLDVRMQKVFGSGPARVTGLIEAYNVLNTATEIEEFTVTGSDRRLTSSVQPPRSIHVGVRVDF